MTGLFVFLAMLSSGHAQTVLVQAPQSRTLDYKASLKAHSDFISPAQEYLNTHPSLAQREQLLELFSSAQKIFMEKSNDEAAAKFTELLGLLWVDDWAKADREIFLQAYLRLAQIAVTPEKRDHWLGLSLLLGADLNYDPTLFPPPLLVRRAELAAQLPKKLITRKSIGGNWSHILINGRPCENQDCGIWPLYPGRVRVTLLSDQWQPESSVVDIADITRLRPHMVAWVTGDCAQAHWDEAATRFAQKKAFWSLECDRPNLAEALNLSPGASNEAAEKSRPAAFAAPPASADKSTPFYESKWLWAGVGTLIAIVIVASSQKHESKETSTTYGY